MGGGGGEGGLRTRTLRYISIAYIRISVETNSNCMHFEHCKHCAIII